MRSLRNLAHTTTYCEVPLIPCPTFARQESLFLNPSPTVGASSPSLPSLSLSLRLSLHTIQHDVMPTLRASWPSDTLMRDDIEGFAVRAVKFVRAVQTLSSHMNRKMEVVICGESSSPSLFYRGLLLTIEARQVIRRLRSGWKPSRPLHLMEGRFRKMWLYSERVSKTG